MGCGLLPVIKRSESWARRRTLYEQLLTSQDTFVLVARRGSAAVGYAFAHVHMGPDDTWDTGDRIGEVESLAVLPAERGRGLGTLLLDCAEAILERSGARDGLTGLRAYEVVKRAARARETWGSGGRSEWRVPVPLSARWRRSGSPRGRFRNESAGIRS